MIGAILFLAAACSVADVDVFIGTTGVGHASPAAAYPFGGLQPGPNTSASPDCYLGDWAHVSGYQRTDPYLWRFTQRRVNGTGVPSLCDLGLFPYVDEPTNGVHSARMDKSSERAEPGWYAVRLENGTAAEMTALAHTAAYRIAYPKDRTARLLVDLDFGALTVTNDVNDSFGRYTRSTELAFRTPTRLEGTIDVLQWCPYRLHFALETSVPIRAKRCLRTAGDGHGETWTLEFEPADGRLELRLALSQTSVEAASRNLACEMPRFDFDGARAKARAKWNEMLSRVEIGEGGDPSVARNFLGAYYRTLFQPNDVGDVGKPHYSTLSLWDTFRAAHPLYTILAGEYVDAFVNSMLDVYDRNGYLPIWGLAGTDNHCMIGHHAVPVIVDAYLKGFRGFDAARAFAAVRDSLTRGHKAANCGTWALLKEDWDLYDTYGYYPFDLLRGRGSWPGAGIVRGESVARTLECSYDDACAARMAKALGKAEDEAFFARRAGFWRNVYDPSVGFMRGKDSRGRWREPFDPYKLGAGPWLDNDFCEGNSYQYSWHVLQDPAGLVAAMGGSRKAGEKLDALFAAQDKTDGDSFTHDVSGLIGQYAHGNEPSHHIAYLYAWTDRPQRTAEVVRQVFDTQYAPTDGGLCGNDDCGQMAAWYVFSAMGFYPLDPCGGDYVIGAPQLPKVTLRLPGGRAFSIVARNLSTANRYVKSVTLNGKPLDGFILRHADLMRGGELVFTMTSEAINGRNGK